MMSVPTSITTPITESGFAPWSMMAPTNESKVALAKGTGAFSINDPAIAEKARKPVQAASLNTAALHTATPLEASLPVSDNPYVVGKDRENNPGTVDATRTGAQDSMGVLDFLDVINPLQHIPGIGAIYRSLTGDEIATPARIAGGSLFGGPFGFMVSVLDSVFAEETGRDMGGHMLALFSDDAASDQSGKKNTNFAQSVADNQVGTDKTIKTSTVAETLPPPYADPALDDVATTLAAPESAGAISISHGSGAVPGVIPGAIPGANMNNGKPALPARVEAAPANPTQADLPQVTPLQIAALEQTNFSSRPEFKTPEPNPAEFKPLSKDVERQLEHIKRLRNQTASTKARMDFGLSQQPDQQTRPGDNNAHNNSAQIAAYQNAQAAAQGLLTTAPVNISAAMMEALQKYDALLNGN